MEHVLGALAVYKAVQLFELALPRQVMPWVKVVVGVAFGYLAAWLVSADHVWVSGLVIATLASLTHGVLRFLTLAGDLAMRRTLR